LSATKNNAHNRQINGDVKAKVKKIVTTIRKLKEEQREIAEEIKNILAEAKATGLDSAAIRELISEMEKKEKNPEKWQDKEDMKDVLRIALGMV